MKVTFQTLLPQFQFDKMDKKNLLFFTLLCGLLRNGIGNTLEGSTNRDEVEVDVDPALEIDVEPRRNPVRGVPVQARQFDVCDGVGCYSNQICERFDYNGDAFPICHDPALYAFSKCSPGKCQNGGTCIGGRCFCPPNVHGTVCETNSTFCTKNPCEDDYTCVTVSGGGFWCQLPSPPSVCIENNCMGDGCECVPSCMHENGYYCRSRFGFIGKHCNIGPPEVICSASQIRVVIPEEFALEYGGYQSVAILYVSPVVDVFEEVPSCHAELNVDRDYVVTINSPFDACGTRKVTGIDGVIVYKNSVWVNRRGSEMDFPHSVIDFNCTYDRNYQIVTSLRPVVDTSIASLTGSMRGDISVGLCKISTCSASCPSNLVVAGNAIYTVGERIHFTTSLTMPFSAGSYSTEIVDAHLSCDRLMATPSTFVLKHECEDGRAFGAMFGQRTSNVNCGSFRVPRILACPKMFYIHLRVVVCARFTTMNCPSNGASYKVCSNRISKRAVSSRDNISYHVIGPIGVRGEGYGFPSFALTSDNGTTLVIAGEQPRDISTEVVPTTPGIPLLATFVVSCSVLILLSIVLIILSFRRNVPKI